MDFKATTFIYMTMLETCLENFQISMMELFVKELNS